MPECPIIADLKYVLCDKLVHEYLEKERQFDDSNIVKKKGRKKDGKKYNDLSDSDSSEGNKKAHQFSFVPVAGSEVDKLEHAKRNVSICKNAYSSALKIDYDMKKKCKEDTRFDVNNMNLGSERIEPADKKKVKKISGKIEWKWMDFEKILLLNYYEFY